MNIPLKWTENEKRYFSKPIPRMERRSWFDKLEDWFIWAVIAMMAGATIWVWWMNYQIYLIRAYVRSI
jgi:hypothetical protein